MKIAVIYQVIFHYRVPLYENLVEDSRYKTKIFYGADNPTNKNKSIKNHNLAQAKKLYTWFISYKNKKGENVKMSFFPCLFFQLLFFNPKVIFTEGASGLPNLLIAFLYAKLFRKKIIYWSLGAIPGEKKMKGGFFGKFIGYIEKNVDAIFTYSTFGKNYFLSNSIPESKIFVGVNVLGKKIEQTKKIPHLEFNILFVGTVIKEKKLELLIDAFEIFNEKYTNAKLYIVGDGPYWDNVKTYCQSKNNGSIILPGRVIEGVDEYFRKADIFVLPGLGGLSISEAMHYELPVITGSADGTELDLVHPDSGIKLSDVTAFTLFQAIEYLYLNNDIRINFGEKAKYLINNDYSFNSYYNKLINSISYALKK